MGELRQKLESLSRGELVGLAIVLLAVLAGAGLWYARSLPRLVQIAATPGPAPASSSGEAALGVDAPQGAEVSGVPASAQPAELIVDVTGWVRRPGVYRLDPGARVIDAVERAGGAKGGADLSLLNLAAPLSDGQQILVPKKGDPSTGAGAGTTGTTGVTGTTGGLVNINTADAATLETLNGVGPVLAAAIIQYRTENGPFASVDQLDQVSGIGSATLELLRDQVTV